MKHNVIFILILAFFLFLCLLPSLSLPGLGGDESNGPRLLIQMIQYPKMIPQCNLRIQIFGKVFPLLDRPYQSSLYMYMYFPFAYIGGINIYTIRITHIFYGLIILILCYLLIKNLFGPKKALVALLLISTLPFFVFGIKTDGEYYMYMIPVLITLLFFLKFYETKKRVYFYLSSFALGFGIYYGAIFWVFTVSILLTLLVCHFKEIKISKKYVIPGLFFLLLGSLPLVVYNLKNLDTIRYTKDLFLKGNDVSWDRPYGFTAQSPVEMVQQNIITRVMALKIIMRGSSFPLGVTFPITVQNPLNLLIVLSALIFSIFKVISRKTSRNEKIKIKTVLCFLAFFILISSLMSSSFLRDHQLAITIPLLSALSADFLGFLYKKCKICVVIAFLAIIGLNLAVIGETHNSLLNYGFFSPEHPSDSISALGDYFYKNKITQPINVGMGYGRSDFQNNIFVLTQGLSWSLNLFRTEDSKQYFMELAENSENIYVLPAANIKQTTEIEHYRLFENYVKEANKTLVTEKIFTDRSGQPEFIIYKLQEANSS